LGKTEGRERRRERGREEGESEGRGRERRGGATPTTQIFWPRSAGVYGAKLCIS